VPARGSAFTIRQPLDQTSRQGLSADLLARIDAYWRAANYLSVGQIYLFDNPLLKKTAQA
jgi:xylulose-5-phosphate/fructose-6-phosphate phosphoketolase